MASLSYNKCNLQRRFKLFSRSPTTEGMNDVLSHALHIINGFVSEEQGQQQQQQQQPYVWLKLQMKIWKSNAMTRCSDIIYSFKQISVHLDYVHKLTIMRKITYTQPEKDMYIDILSEYAELLQKVVGSSYSETERSGEGSSDASSGSPSPCK